MPTYQYACTDCAHRFELVQSFTDPAASECPECGSAVRKVYSAVGVVFKGSGFYRNDSRESAKAAASSKSSKSSESGSEGKSESKPATESVSSSSSSSSDSSSSSSSSDSGSSNSGSSAAPAASNKPAAVAS